MIFTSISQNSLVPYQN